MSFSVIEKGRAGSKAEGISLGISRDKARKSPVLTIRLAPDAMAAAGLVKGQRVEVALGRFSDGGLLRLAKSDGNGWAVNRAGKSSTTFSVEVPAVWIAAGTTHVAIAVNFRMADDGALLIALPSWAQPKEAK